jgi:predicted nuclease of predicted toxin-antitoxin system
MRFLADENISWRLKKLLPEWDILPSNEIKLEHRLTDRLIWEYARDNQYAILTFDEDFAELQNLLYYPPKIIWLRIGNVTTAEIAGHLSMLKQKSPALLQGFLISNKSFTTFLASFEYRLRSL